MKRQSKETSLPIRPLPDYEEYTVFELQQRTWFFDDTTGEGYWSPWTTLSRWNQDDLAHFQNPPAVLMSRLANQSSTDYREGIDDLHDGSHLTRLVKVKMVILQSYELPEFKL